MRIIQTITKQVKKSGTKTVFINESRKVNDITSQQYKNATCDDTLKFFRRLGGPETVTRNYTCRGYLITRVVSTSPDKEKRTIREYIFN